MLTTSELEQGRCHLEQAREEVLAVTRGLSEAQWHFKPSPDRWSTAENLEHMVLTQDLLLGPIRQQLAESERVAEAGNRAEIDQAVLTQIPDRSMRFPGPEFLQPAGRWTPANSLNRLVDGCSRLIEHLESTPNLREQTLESPPLRAVTKGAIGIADGYQWVLTAAGHNRRHANQILELKADPGFPPH